GTYIATGEQDSTIHFWVVQTGQDLQMWGYETKALQLSWNHTGRYLATGGSASIVIWDCSGKGPEGTTPQMLKGHTAPVSALAYQPRGALLASGGQDGRVALWPMDQPKRGPLITQMESSITQLVWAPDTPRVAVGTEAGLVVVLGSP
ncbi:MAG TPA: WD40 repeat domain-containing protein, partial [Ktedonobacterales bacterium]